MNLCRYCPFQQGFRNNSIPHNSFKFTHSGDEIGLCFSGRGTIFCHLCEGEIQIEIYCG